MNVDPDYSAAYVVLKTDSPGPGGPRPHVHLRPRHRSRAWPMIHALEPLVRRQDPRIDHGGHGRRSGAASRRTASSDGSARRRASIHLAHGRDRQRHLGPLGPSRRKARLEARRRSDARAVRVAASTSTTSPTRSRPRKRWRCCAKNAPTQAPRARRRCCATAIPAYTTSAGWLGYADDKIRRLCREGARRRLDALQDESRRAIWRTTSAACAIVREEIGRERQLMIDANQAWDVGEAIRWMQAARAVRSLVDRGADQPGRRPGPRGDRAGGRADRRRDRRALPEPRDVQAAPPGERDRASARSTAAGSAA